MSTLTSASTLAEAKASYFDNASYAEDSSVAKCRAFITACRFLLLMMPKRASHGGRSGEEIEIAPEVLQAEKTAAESWLVGQDTSSGGSGGVVFADLSNYRS